MKGPDIKYLFEPRNVAVIGASVKKNKIGHKIVRNLLFNKFPGKVFPINPKGGKILGLDVEKSILDIKDPVDMACIAIPEKFVFDTVKQCAQKKVKFLVIITSGFSEIGNIKEEKQLVQYAKKNGMRILGPNIFGIYSSKVSMNATFGQKDILSGNVAIITQSGALGIAMMGKTKTENIGLSAMVSVGNKSDIDESDLLKYLVENKETKVIMMYVEGVKHGERLVGILKKATKKKPIIVIKSGRSKRGAMAAASHTGSLAGADEIFSDIMKQCGVMRAESVEEAFDWCKYLANSPMPKGKNTVIVTNGGGMGVMAADACEKFGVSLYDDTETLKKIFSDSVPSFGSVKNPVDITGQARVGDYEKSLFSAIKNKNIHSIICLGCETAVLDVKNLKKVIKEVYAECKKPIVFSFLGGTKLEHVITHLREKGTPIYSNVYEAVSCLGAMYNHFDTKYSIFHEKKINPADYSIDMKKIKSIISDVKKEHRNFLLSDEAQELMSAADITFPKTYIASSIEEAVASAEEIGFPVVLKVVSKDIIHKSDVGGVKLNLSSVEEVIDAYQAIIHNCRHNKPNANIKGIEVTEMVKKGTETIIGARRDASFGPIVMFGLGGIYVEVMKDVSFRGFPLPKKEVKNMVKETKTYPLLLGVRGEKKKDINKIVDTIMKLGIIIKNCRYISDIEINPLVVYEKGIKAVDIRILLTN
ncbi:CoA-binding protein [Candidatus Woesearchaeota archaeon]|nr:CoA-binding protein [Candidatus Woesearchaeota archaeon]